VPLDQFGPLSKYVDVKASLPVGDLKIIDAGKNAKVLGYSMTVLSRMSGAPMVSRHQQPNPQ
jgi:hypothetical protein